MLVKYEFLKILRRKSTGIVMAVSLLVTVFFFGLPVQQYQAYDREAVIEGIKGIAYDKEEYTALSVPLTENYVTETIRSYQQLFENPDNVGYNGREKFIIGDAYWDFVAPREKLLRMMGGTYENSGETVSLSNLPDLDISAGADFYGTREDKIEALLSTPERTLSDEQKVFWRGMNQKVKIPLQYGYHEGWEIILNSFELLTFALLGICTVLAPVFAGEYQAGTDAVILSARYGKTKLITAKLMASFLFGILAFTLHVIAALGIPLLAFGAEGWDLPLQIANTEISYPLTFLQVTAINLAVVYLVLLGLIGVTLLLSAKMKSPYFVLLVLVPILFLPLFLAPNGTTGAYNLTLFLLPYRATVAEVGKYISYQFGGLVLDTFSVRAILYGAIAVFTLPLTRFCFRKHQVSA